MDRTWRLTLELTALIGGLALYAAALAIPADQRPAIPIAEIGLTIAGLAFIALLVELVAATAARTRNLRRRAVPVQVEQPQTKRLTTRQLPWVGPDEPRNPSEGDVWIKTPTPAPRDDGTQAAASSPGSPSTVAAPQTVSPPTLSLGSPSAEPEKATVAIHWLGGEGVEYFPGISSDPTVTTWVTPSKWRDLMPKRDAEGFPVFALGEAPPRVDEAHRRRELVERHFLVWFDKAKNVANELRDLKGDDLDEMNRLYWKNRVMDAEREIENQVRVRMPGVIERPSPIDPDTLRIDDHWSSVYRHYLDSRLAEYQRFAQPTLADVGFPPRRADPTSSFGYTNKWNKAVEFRADDQGIVQPLNDEENRFLDGMSLPRA